MEQGARYARTCRRPFDIAIGHCSIEVGMWNWTMGQDAEWTSPPNMVTTAKSRNHGRMSGSSYTAIPSAVLQ